MRGDRRRELPHLPALLAAGLRGRFSVEYRLSGEALFPAAVRDVKQATAYLRARAAELGLDPRSSRHGDARPAATSPPCSASPARRRPVRRQATEFDGPGGDSSVQAVVDWYGPSDFLVMDAQFTARPPDGDVPPVQNHDEPGSPESKWIGGPIQELPEVTARANPITYITGAGAPLPVLSRRGHERPPSAVPADPDTRRRAARHGMPSSSCTSCRRAARRPALRVRADRAGDRLA